MKTVNIKDGRGLRVFLYRRVSSAEQAEGSSLQEQHRVNQQFCEGKGHKVVGTFEDVQTAAKVGRRQFDAMVRKLKRGQADGLVFHKVDRSTRNYRDWAIISKLMDAGYYIAFASERLESSDTGGRLTMDLLVAMAVHYIRNLRDETKKGLRGRVRDGYWPWKAPLGYVNVDPETGETQRCMKYLDPVRAPLIEELFKLYVSRQYTIQELAQEITRRGLRTRTGKDVSFQKICKILDNPYYAGLLRHEGQLFEGRHQPTISISLWRRAAELRKGPQRHRHADSSFCFKGVLQCGFCGLPLVGERQKGKVYYRCHHRGTHSSNCIRESNALSQLAELLSSTKLSREEGRMVEILLSEARADQARARRDHEALQRLKRGKLEAKKKKALEAFLSGVLDAATYKDVESEVATELVQLKEQAEADSRMLRPSITTEMLDCLQKLDAMLLERQGEARRQLLLALFSNVVVREKIVEAKPRKWLSILISRKDFPIGTASTAVYRTRDAVLSIPEDLLGIFEQDDFEPVPLSYRYDSSTLAPLGESAGQLI